MGDNEPGHTSGEDFIERPVEECILDGGAWQFQCNYENGWCRSLNGRPTGVHQVLSSVGEIVCKGPTAVSWFQCTSQWARKWRTHFERLVNWNGREQLNPVYIGDHIINSTWAKKWSQQKSIYARISGFERSRIMKMLDTLFAEVDVLFVSKIEELVGNIELSLWLKRTRKERLRLFPLTTVSWEQFPAARKRVWQISALVSPTKIMNTSLAPIGDDIEPIEAPREGVETKMKIHWKSTFRTRMNAKNLRSREKQDYEDAGHAVCRSRCPVCVEDRGVDGKHRIEFMTEEDKKRTTPIVSFNYGFMTQENADIFPILICRHIRYGQTVTLCCAWKRIWENSISFLVDSIKVLIFEVSFWNTTTKRARNHFKMWGLNYESLRKWFLRPSWCRSHDQRTFGNDCARSETTLQDTPDLSSLKHKRVSQMTIRYSAGFSALQLKSWT